MLPVAIGCFRAEWMSMYRSLQAAIKPQPQPICPEPEEGPGALP
jgi:hypothetical protein